MKKFLYILLVVFVSITLIACPDSPNSNTPDESNEVPVAKDELSEAIQGIVGEVYPDLYIFSAPTLKGIVTYTTLDESGNVIYTQELAYSAEGTTETFSIEQKLGDYSKGDVIEFNGSEWTLNGTTVSNQDPEGEIVKAAGSKIKKSVESWDLTGSEYGGKNINVICELHRVTAYTSEKDFTQNIVEKYTIENGNVEGITYLGIYYDFVQESGSFEYKNGIIDIKGEVGLQGTYSATADQLYDLFY